jgi:hypothetical protein
MMAASRASTIGFSTKVCTGGHPDPHALQIIQFRGICR